MSSLATSDAPAAPVTLYCTLPAVRFSSASVGLELSFRTHPQVVAFTRIYSSVVLSQVKVTVSQLVLPTTSEDYDRIFLKFGVVPTGVAIRDPATRSSVVGYLPHLVQYATGFSGTDLTITWGEGGLPFPPGVQLDLAAAEVSAKYAAVLIGDPITIPRTDTTPIVGVTLDFSVKCSSLGFGAVF